MLIGLMGRARAGKSEVAKILEGQGFTRLEFGPLVMDMLLRFDPYFVADNGFLTRTSTIYSKLGYEGFKEQKEGRRLLQEFGTGMRDVDPYFWVMAMMNKIETTEGNIVVAGIRFQNEYNMIRGLEGKLWRVERYGLQLSSHVSETSVEDLPADITIHNDDTLSHLADTVSKLLAHEGEFLVS